jgi:hypothetical protein
MALRRSSVQRGHRLLVPLVLALVLVTGCSAFGRPDAPEPAPPSSLPRNTMDIASVGMTITVTATVESVITPTSFVVRDADLPFEGLLVLSAAVPGLRPSDLVTIDGEVVLFRFADLAAAHGLTAEAPYSAFEGEKVVEARDVRSWA